MNHNIIYLVIAWSLLAFVGYNLLSVEAKEKNDVPNIREMKFVNDDLDDYGLKDMALEQACKDNGGQWKESAWCKFDKIGGNDEIKFEHEMAERGLDYYYYDFEYGNDEWQKIQNEKYEKSLKGEQEYQKYVAKQEEIAAQEDAICDNEDADTTDIKLCMAEERLQQSAFNIGKEECKQVNGDWKKDRCTYYEDEQQEQEDLERAQTEQLPVIEDWSNEVYPTTTTTEEVEESSSGEVVVEDYMEQNTNDEEVSSTEYEEESVEEEEQEED